MTTETIEGATPNGGVRSTAFFQDAQGNAADQSVAINVEIVEYDKDGNGIF